MNIPAFYRLLTIFKPYIYSIFNLQYYSIVDLQGRTGTNGEKIYVDSYYASGMYTGAQRTGMRLVYRSTQAKSGHNGVTVHSPTVTWDGTQSGLSAYLAGTGETDPSGTGCWVLEYNVLNVYMGGAIGDSVVDDLAAFRAVSGTGVGSFYVPKPSSKYRFSDILTLQNGQEMYGDGVTESIIYVDTTFNLSALGVVRLGTAEQGAQIDKIGIEFEQTTAASTGLRADLIEYPPGIYAVGASRFVIGHVRISNGYNGVDMSGNTGGARIEFLESGCFNKNLIIDGALDFIHIGTVHVWPFKIASTANLLNIYYDGDTYALDCGRCDGLTMDHFDAFRAKLVFTNPSSTAILPYKITSLSLDGDGARLIWNEGRGEIGQIYSTKTTSPIVPSLDVSGGKLTIGNGIFSGSEQETIKVTGGFVAINGGELYNNSADRKGATVSAGVLELNNVALNWATGARTATLIDQSGTGVLRMNDCRPVILSPVSTLASFATDVAGNCITGQTLKPHNVTYPSTLNTGTYSSQTLNGQISATFATPGDISVAYGVRTAYWGYAHGFGRINFRFVFTPTFTTSSGNLVLSVSGFPTSLTQASEMAVVGFSGITMTGGRTDLMARIASTGEIQLWEYAPGVAMRQLSVTNFTTATQVSLFFSGVFLL